MNTLKPYPTYKPAGIPWLKQVPEHWEVLPNRALFSEVKEAGRPEDEMLSVTIRRGVLKQAEHLATSSKKDSSRKDKSTYKRVGVGDIVYNKMRAWQGAFGESKYSGIVSPAYVVQRPKEGALPEFYHFLMRSPLFAKEAERNSYGLASDIWNLRPEDFKTILNVRPPIEEQHLIVRYVHALDAKVKRYIRSKRSLIARLQEQKQAIIQQAVTRGLDPNVKLKPSGVEWLGEVPVHWEVVRLKSCITDINDQTKFKLDDEDYIALEHVESWSGLAHPLSGKVHFESAVKRYRVGDVLFGKLRPYLAKACLPEKAGVCVGELLVLRQCGYKFLPEFLLKRLLSKDFIDIVSASTQGAKMPRADWGFIGNSVFAVPTDLNEQSAILERLNSKTQTIDRLLKVLASDLAFILEYQTLLIADVVTGAVDVRAAAQAMPVEVETDFAEAMADEEEPLSMAAEGEEGNYNE
ncbi:MAG: restriction endonuclease subunit S [Flavobacteriales bacterium]|nr:restriction endonuclease subunit S [Flavobacteriales bacterium]